MRARDREGNQNRKHSYQIRIVHVRVSRALHVHTCAHIYDMCIYVCVVLHAVEFANVCIPQMHT